MKVIPRPCGGVEISLAAAESKLLKQLLMNIGGGKSTDPYINKTITRVEIVKIRDGVMNELANELLPKDEDDHWD